MKNHRSGEFELPNEVIQHIQSFMSGKLAAQTAILSKLWHSAWSTRPKLVFRHDLFHTSADEFPEFTRKTMQRYEDLNIKIHTFELQMSGQWNLSLASELIVRAMRIGAVYLEIHVFNSPFVLPDEVLESETLIRLSVHGCKVNLHKRNITCSKLKFLEFTGVTVISGDLVRDLILRCPLIEGLTADGIYRRRKLPGFHSNKYSYSDALDVRESVHKHALWPKLAHLKELLISPYQGHADYNWSDARICSQSLERIVIDLHREILKAEFDVPNLRRFEFHGSPLSHLRFKATSHRKWESDLHIHCYARILSASWLSSLDQFVEMLSRDSKVSLSVAVKTFSASKGCVWDEVAACLATRPLVVESLKLVGSETKPAFMDSLFSIFRPKFVIRGYYARDAITKYLLELVCKRVLEEVNEKAWKDRYGQNYVRFQLIWRQKY